LLHAQRFVGRPVGPRPERPVGHPLDIELLVPTPEELAAGLDTGLARGTPRRTAPGVERADLLPVLWRGRWYRGPRVHSVPSLVQTHGTWSRLSWPRHARVRPCAPCLPSS